MPHGAGIFTKKITQKKWPSKLQANLPTPWFASALWINMNQNISKYEGVQKWGYPQIIPILVGFSLINPPFWEIPISGNTHMWFNHK